LKLHQIPSSISVSWHCAADFCRMRISSKTLQSKTSSEKFQHKFITTGFYLENRKSDVIKVTLFSLLIILIIVFICNCRIKHLKKQRLQACRMSYLLEKRLGVHITFTRKRETM